MSMPTYPAAAEAITDTLRTNCDFMRIVEICDASGLDFLHATKTVDWMYCRREILKRFRLGELAVIVDVEEVPVPEFGYSGSLDNLLKSIGVNRRNWTQLQVDYGLDRGWSDKSPTDNEPMEPLQQIQPNRQS